MGLVYCIWCNTPLQNGGCNFCYDNKDNLEEFEQEEE
jgi:hypothetical protein